VRFATTNIDRLRDAGFARLIQIVDSTWTPFAVLDIADAGALPVIVGYLSEPFDDQPRLQRKALCVLKALLQPLESGVMSRFFEDGAVPRLFLEPQLVPHMLRHLRHANAEVAHLAVAALRFVVADDHAKTLLLANFGDLLHGPDGAVAALVNFAKKNDDPENSVAPAMPAVTTLVSLAICLDNATDIISSIVPVLQRALADPECIDRALQTIHCINGVGAPAVGLLAATGIIRDVVAVVANPCESAIFVMLWTVLFQVCDSPDQAHKAHVVDCGLLESLPAIIGACTWNFEVDYVARALTALARDNVAMLRRVLDEAPEAITGIARRLHGSYIGDDTGRPRSVKCLTTIARTADPQEHARLLEAGVPESFFDVAASDDDVRSTF